jgi:hypothetical protein
MKKQKAMKTKLCIAVVVMTAVIFSCENNDGSEFRPTAAQLKASHKTALNGITQQFTFTAGSGNITFTSDAGVTINLNSDALALNGNPVNGTVTLNFIEIFDKGTMAITHKPTRGLLPNGDLAMLDSGGQFFINAVQNGQQLEIEGLINLDVPVNDMNGINDNMGLWVGVDNDTVSDTPVIWNEANDPAIGQGVILTNGSYFCTFANFGWCNIDMFVGDPRPKTTILARVPDGYDDQNCRVYLSYDGYGRSLANLDTYTQDGYFSEHYGQIPIGMECHAIFMTVENGNYRYAIKPVTITQGGIINFIMADTTTGTSGQLVAAINAVQ